MSESDFRKISVAGIVFLVLLRLAIGWQLLYEGLWKFQTVDTAQPWTSEPYLKNAQGPLRDYFRGLTGDPNDLHDLDYETVAQRWSDWAERFSAHYELDEKQRRSLMTMLEGPKEFTRPLEKLPEVEGLDLAKIKSWGLTYDAKNKRLVVDGQRHMTPREKHNILQMVGFNETTDQVSDIEDDTLREFVKQVLIIYDQQARLSFKERALATLKGDPEWAGVIDPDQKGTHDEKKLGKIEIYRNRLARYEEKLDKAKTQFDQSHLQYDWKEIQKLRSELVGPIRSMEADLKWRAEKLLSTDQLARGPLPAVMTPQRDIDLKTMWGLTLIGGFLIAGLFTRVAALAGAFLLLQFYLSYPPFPGYPEPPGTEHSLIVNKNFVEVLVLMAMVFLPSGRWFGIDAIFSGLFTKKTVDDKK